VRPYPKSSAVPATVSGEPRVQYHWKGNFSGKGMQGRDPQARRPAVVSSIPGAGSLLGIWAGLCPGNPARVQHFSIVAASPLQLEN
jgi:hypothetical protein